MPSTSSIPTLTPFTHQHTLHLEVQIFDTDCYGVMWHGAYTKWLEIGRVKYFESLGYKLPRPNDRPGHVFPVVNQNLTFKSPGKLWAHLNLTTKLALDRSRLIFTQTVTHSDTQDIIMTSQTTCAIVEATEDGNWKPCRRIPESIQQALDTVK